LLIADLPSTAKILRPTNGDFNKLITDHGQGPCYEEGLPEGAVYTR
jgi:hypothetical protein